MKKAFFLTLVTGLLVSAGMKSQDIPLEKWAEKHPEASRSLGEWVKKHPKAAHKIFEWDGRHPERSQEFVNWTIAHPAEKLGAFVRQHPGEPGLDEILKNHAEGAEDFMFWCRNHAPAAKALMAHPRGLEWAGNHLYKEAAGMESK